MSGLTRPIPIWVLIIARSVVSIAILVGSCEQEIADVVVEQHWKKGGTLGDIVLDSAQLIGLSAAHFQHKAAF